MLVDHGLELLTEEESLSLLGDGEVGRIGLTMGALPAIFPVNYRLLDGDIVVRTAPGSKLAAAATGAVVAFEVDDYERDTRVGWSVLVVGPSEVVHDLEVTFKVVDVGLEPWADAGSRTSIIRIRPELVTGRRICRTSA